MINKVIPIVMMLTYGKNVFTFQVNPAELKKIIKSPSISADVGSIGEVSIPTTPKLATMTISSLLWQDKDLVPNTFYVKWLEKWQQSKKPAYFVITTFDFSMYVTCEGFDYTQKAGEEGDYYYNLELRQYRQYGARLVGKVKDKSLVDILEDTKTLPVLVPIPIPMRIPEFKEIPKTIIAINSDSWGVLAKKYTGSSKKWYEVYELNKDKADSTGKIIPESEIEIPESWQ